MVNGRYGEATLLGHTHIGTIYGTYSAMRICRRVRYMSEVLPTNRATQASVTSSHATILMTGRDGLALISLCLRIQNKNSLLPTPDFRALWRRLPLRLSL